MVGILGHQHMGEQSRARPPALDRQGRHRRLRDHLAQAADDFGADMPDDLEQGDALQHLGLVLAEPAQLSANRQDSHSRDRHLQCPLANARPPRAAGDRAMDDEQDAAGCRELPA